MDDYTKLLMRCGTAVIIAVTVTFGSCSIHKQSVLRDMVESGTDPQRAACAVYYGESTSTEPTCALLAVKQSGI